MQTNKMLMILLAVLGLILIGLLVVAGVLLVRDSGSGSNEPIAANVTGTALAAATLTPSPIPATATSATLPAPAVVVLPTNTPLPATATPIPTDTPVATETPLPTATGTALPPTNTPRPFIPATSTNTPVPPTNTPPPPPIGVAGLIATHFALQPRSVYAVNQQIWFEFTVSNSTGGLVEFGALGVMPRKGGNDRVDMVQVSWGGNPGDGVPANGLTHEDNIRLSESGSYTLRLAVCFEDYNACKSGAGTWHSLSPEIAVTIP